MKFGTRSSVKRVVLYSAAARINLPTGRIGARYVKQTLF